MPAHPVQTFRPYAIQHLQLLDAVRYTVPNENTYLVLWWQKIPLGHLWLEKSTFNQNPEQFRNEVAKAVRPALDYYFLSTRGAADWQTPFVQGNTDPVQRLLQANTLLQTFSNPHAATGRISVVICTRNRTQALEHCINALLQSTDTDFELVIVDNAPDNDSTQQLVQNYPGVVYVRENRKGLDIARNTGARTASCPVVAYTDDDVTVEKDWIKNMKACFTDPQTACVTGLVVPLELKTESQYRFERYWGFNKGYVPLVFDKAYFEKHKESGVPVWDVGAGANMAFRKSLFDAIGYFDERLDVGAAGCSGDSEMWYRALAEGYQCNYFPHLFVYHQHRSSEKELDNQIFYYMRGQVASLLVQYERYRHKGNLKRLYRDLPKWYKDRIKHKLLGRYSPHYKTLFTEIRGCISGWRFYRANRLKP
jgi:GT2 family glycosyltransferase